MRQIAYILATVILAAIFGSLVVSPTKEIAFPRELPYFVLDESTKNLDQSDAKKKGFSKSLLYKHWTLAYFGYTHCPDICPATLSKLKEAVDEINLNGMKTEHDLQVLFVSVDPERDNLERMARYLSFYDQSFIGATAPSHSLKALLGALDSDSLVGRSREAENYTVYHPNAVFIFNPNAQYAGKVKEPFTGESLRIELIKLMLGFDNKSTRS